MSFKSHTFTACLAGAFFCLSLAPIVANQALAESISSARNEMCNNLILGVSNGLENRTPEALKATLDYKPYHYSNQIRRGFEVEGTTPEGVSRLNMTQDLVRGLKMAIASLKRSGRALNYHDIIEIYQGARPIFMDEIPPTNEPSYNSFSPKGFKIVQTEAFPVGRYFEYKKHEWTIVPDFTILSEGKSLDAELTSPIIASDLDEEIFFAGLKFVKSITGFAPNDSSGLHVHVDFPKPRKQELALLYWIFSKVERDLRTTLNMHESYRDRYIVPLAKPDEVISSQFLKRQRSMAMFLSSMEEVAFSNFDGAHNRAKYHSMNILSVRDKGTVEFRIFPSTTDAQRMRLYSRFCTELVRHIRSQSTSLMEMLIADQGKGQFGLRQLEAAISVSLDPIR